MQNCLIILVRIAKKFTPTILPEENQVTVLCILKQKVWKACHYLEQSHQGIEVAILDGPV